MASWLLQKTYEIQYFHYLFEKSLSPCSPRPPLASIIPLLKGFAEIDFQFRAQFEANFEVWRGGEVAPASTETLLARLLSS